MTGQGRRWPAGCLWAGVVLAAWLLVGAPALASERWQVLVVGESSGGTLAPGHPAWRRAEAAITQSLMDSGFSVHDRGALGLVEECKGGDCGHRSVREYVEWAKEHAARMPGARIDLIVIFGVVASQHPGAATPRWQIRVPVRMVHVDNAEVIEQWNGSEAEFLPQAGCTDACLADSLAGQVTRVADDAGAIVTEKLNSLERQHTYQIRAVGFTRSELDGLESALRTAPDYQSGGLRLLDGQNVEREWLHRRASRQYEFRTSSGSGSLHDLLQRILAAQGTPADVVLEGRQVQLTRSGMPYAGRYLAAAVLPLLALIAGWLAWDYRRHERVLAGFSQARAVGPGLEYLERLSRRPLPLLPRWQDQAAGWRQARADGDADLARAEAAVRAGQFDEARRLLAAIQETEPEHPGALALVRALPDRERARRLLDAASRCLDSDPASSAKALTRAQELDGLLREPVRPLLARAQEGLRQGLVRSVQLRARQALEGGRPYAALSMAGRGLAAIGGLEGMEDEREQLKGWCERACSVLTPLTGPALGAGLLAGVRFLVDDHIEIGRGDAGTGSGIGLGFKRASRLGRQVRISREPRGLVVIDKGSSNGTLLDGRLLVPGASEPLDRHHEMALGGQRDPPSPGACRLKLQVLPEEGRSLVLTVDRSIARILDPATLATSWPSLNSDLLQTWVLLSDAVPFCLGERLLPAEPGQEPAFWLGYSQGYFLLPGGGAADGDTAQVQVAGELLTTLTPLMPGTRVALAGREFWLDEW